MVKMDDQAVLFESIVRRPTFVCWCRRAEVEDVTDDSVGEYLFPVRAEGIRAIDLNVAFAHAIACHNGGGVWHKVRVVVALKVDTPHVPGNLNP